VDEVTVVLGHHRKKKNCKKYRVIITYNEYEIVSNNNRFSETLVRVYIAEDISVQYKIFWGWKSSPVFRPYTFIPNIFQGPQITIWFLYLYWWSQSYSRTIKVQRTRLLRRCRYKWEYNIKVNLAEIGWEIVRLCYGSPVFRPYTFVPNIFQGPQLTVWFLYMYCWSQSYSRTIEVQRTRLLRRCRYKWEYNIKVNLAEIGCEIVLWISGF